MVSLLYIEPADSLRPLYAGELTRRGFEVHPFRSADEAVTAFERGALTVDIALIKVDGYGDGPERRAMRIFRDTPDISTVIMGPPLPSVSRRLSFFDHGTGTGQRWGVDRYIEYPAVLDTTVDACVEVLAEKSPVPAFDGDEERLNLLAQAAQDLFDRS